MLDASLIQQLKRTNISKDSKKTKQRFDELWKAAPTPDKEIIENLTGVGRPSLQRIYKEGSISAKVVAAASQVFNVDPYYLTGEADEPGESSEPGLLEFLQKSGYEDIVTEYKNEHKARRTRKKKEVIMEQASDSDAPADNSTVDTGVADAADEPEQPLESLVVELIIPEPEGIGDEATTASFFDEFCEDDIILLLRSVKIRAKAGVADAVKQAEELRRILMS